MGGSFARRSAYIVGLRFSYRYSIRKRAALVNTLFTPSPCHPSRVRAARAQPQRLGETLRIGLHPNGREIFADVLQVANKQLVGLRVVHRIDRLGKVDDLQTLLPVKN